ncbi:MAG TPA: HDOD domain-containing protein [Chthonomonadaceae bacterium]|nr:HDOD domain-containing protein [Chthonomonadaceae bacterium]
MPPDVKSIRIDRAVFQQTLEKKLADLPPLPLVVTRIMETVNSPDTSAADLNRLIAMDQGLSSKVLRIVNSAYYGFPKRISTITHAVVILGFNTVRNLVLGVSAFGLLAQKSIPYGLNRTKFWEHSVATAVAGSILAKKRLTKMRTAPEEAFIGGLLHDIGTLFLDSYFPVQYAVAMAFAARETKTSWEAENMVLGIDHVTVGRRIAEHWNFPPHLTAMIAGHHEPTRQKEHFEMAAVIHVADWLAWQAGFIASEHTATNDLMPEVAEWLGFDEETLDWAKQELLTQFKACEDLLRIARDG